MNQPRKGASWAAAAAPDESLLARILLKGLMLPAAARTAADDRGLALALGKQFRGRERVEMLKTLEIDPPGYQDFAVA